MLYLKSLGCLKIIKIFPEYQNGYRERENRKGTSTA